MANETAAEHARRCDHKVNHRPEDCPNSAPAPTLAQVIGAYRRELVAEGVDGDEVRMLVIEAARQLLRDPEVPVASRRFKRVEATAGPFGSEVVK